MLRPRSQPPREPGELIGDRLRAVRPSHCRPNSWTSSFAMLECATGYLSALGRAGGLGVDQEAAAGRPGGVDGEGDVAAVAPGIGDAGYRVEGSVVPDELPVDVDDRLPAEGGDRDRAGGARRCRHIQ